MSNLVDTHQARARTLAEEEARRPSGRVDEVVTFAVVALTLALVAVLLTAALRSPPSFAADSNVGNPTLADPILYRLVHSAHTLSKTGQSM
jgi:hypothetical protein